MFNTQFSTNGLQIEYCMLSIGYCLLLGNVQFSMNNTK